MSRESVDLTTTEEVKEILWEKNVTQYGLVVSMYRTQELVVTMKSREQCMLELINQLDGFDPRGNIKVLMATNRPDTLDPALMRPGRLDR